MQLKLICFVNIDIFFENDKEKFNFGYNCYFCNWLKFNYWELGN